MSEATALIKLPASVKAGAARLAEKDGVSVDDWVTTIVSRQIEVAEFFRQRAGDARPEDFAASLAAAPDVPPEPGDEIPDDLVAKLRQMRS